MGELNLSKVETKELKGLIEGEAQNYLQDEATAKESLDDLGEAISEKYGLKKSIFKKICKALYASNIDEKTEEAIQFKEIYQEALGGKIED